LNPRSHSHFLMSGACCFDKLIVILHN
jgi:hypothetical protein